MFLKKNTYVAAMMLSMVALVCGGCIRDNICEDIDNEYPEIGPNDYAVAIDFDLDMLPSEDGGTRAGSVTRVNFHPDYDPDKWECYIDLNNELETYDGDKYSLHILMFDENNNFMFNPQGKDQEGHVNNMFRCTPLGVNESGELRRWRAVFQIPIAVRDYIKENKFKIAVLANWPTNSVESYEGDFEDDVLPKAFLSDKPWAGRNPDLDPGEENGPVSIREFSHIAWDKTYGGKFYNVYAPFTDQANGPGGKMGIYTDWVYNYHYNQDEAVWFIRGFGKDHYGWTRRDYGEEITSRNEEYSDYIPNPQTFRRDFSIEFETDKRVFVYEHLWRLWNFGGLVNVGEGYTPKLLPGKESKNGTFQHEPRFDDDTQSGSDGLGLYTMYYGVHDNTWVQADDHTFNYVYRWANLNEKRFKKIFGRESNELRPGETMIYENNGFTFAIGDNDDYRFEDSDDVTEGGALKYEGSDVTIGRDTETDGGNVYLQLPKKTNNNNYLELYAYATGVLYIKTDNIDDIEIVSNTYDFNLTNNKTKETGDNTWFIDVPNDPGYVRIYSKEGKAKIYEIEMIHKKYLYDSDRRTLLPSSHQLIPMYGIQEFDPVGDYWIPGEVFDLSHYNGYHNPGYNHKPIYLLRSVAKVELFISTQFKENYEAGNKLGLEYRPRIIMRSMNRRARCMPLDIVTPTEQIWANVDQEMLNIQEYGPFYDSSTSDYKVFQNRLAWYFSLWENMWDWKWNGYALDVDRTLESPHVYNAKIDRSDFVRFIRVNTEKEAEASGFEHYVFYMPEKAIDDPDDAGELKANPKVAHIELRLKGEPVLNLDDDNHDRIYFVDYSKSNNIPQRNEERWKTYEKSDAMKYHWPIIRNHVYRYHVYPQGVDDIQVQLVVANPASREVDIPKFE